MTPTKPLVVKIPQLQPVTKSVKKHFVGVPTPITSIKGKIETVSTGDYTTYAIVKI